MAGPNELAAQLGPVRIGLRRDLEVVRQVLHGRPSYMLHDPVSFRSHLFELDEYEVLSSIVPHRSLSETFEFLVSENALRHEDEEEFYQFILALHHKNLLQLPLSDSARLFDRYQLRRKAQRPNPLTVVMYHKIALLDPDQFLTRTIAWLRPLFHLPGLILWLSLVFLALWKCSGRFGEMSAEAHQLLTLSNVPLLYLALVGLKLLHEFGHAYACKSYGGAVPEMGAVFIMTAPCAYVDATASWTFDRTWQRVAVGFAGMYVESFIGAACLLLWAATAPGLLHALALNVVLLSTVMTVFFNLNPLMKYDGYYILSDLIGIPNLRERSLAWLTTKAQRFFLGLPSSIRQASMREQIIYAAYGIGSFSYKVLLAFTITWMAMIRWPVAGALLGIAFSWLLIAKPCTRLFLWLWNSAATKPCRMRARLLGSAAALSIPAALLLLPVSWSVRAPAVLESLKEHVVRAPEAGFIRLTGLKDGRIVSPGQHLLSIEQQQIPLEILRIKQQRLAAQKLLEQVEFKDPVAAREHSERIAYLTERLAQLEQRSSNLSVLAPERGRLVAKQAHRLGGRYVARGEELFRLASGRAAIHALVPESYALRAQLFPGTLAEYRLRSRPSETFYAKILSVKPLSSKKQIPRSLSIQAGGEIYAMRNARGQSQSVEPYLHVLLQPLEELDTGQLGVTASVRIPSEMETLGSWLQRQLYSLYHVWKMS
ncbi:MAG: hypothetical protein CSA62_00700 [Planctomycetota bacterium]|nr:MAG: hypothetical protein CSA62_00700 [Planctomycetota bacterium]